MNLGAFAVVIAGAEKTGSGEIDDWAGLSRYAPGLAVLLAIFFFALAGIPPLAGWFAKFVMFRAVMGGGAGAWGVALAVIAAVNAVIALSTTPGSSRRSSWTRFRPPHRWSWRHRSGSPRHWPWHWVSPPPS